MTYRHTMIVLFIAVALAATCDARAEEDAQTILETLVASDPGDRESVRAVQQALTDLGFDPGPTDGLMGNKTRTAVREWQEGNDYDIASGWLEAPRQAAASGPGWRCTSVDEATSHPGSAATQGGDYLRNVVVMMTGDGTQYMGSSDGSGMYSIPAPPAHCPDGAIYDD